MLLDDALDGFMLALKFSLPEEIQRQRDGIEAFTPKQRLAVKSALVLFQGWKEDQGARIAQRLCCECDLDQDEITKEDAKAVIQCITCGGYFCQYHWVDHLHMSVEHEVPVG